MTRQRIALNLRERLSMRILLFGTGSGLSDFLSVVPEDVEIVGLSDNDVHKQGKVILGHSVHAPDAIGKLNPDFVVVTTRPGEVILTQLVDMGIERERILLFYSNFDADLRAKVNQDLEALNRHLKLRLHPISLCTMPVWPQRKLEAMSSEDDFCRMMSVKLA